ncbi:MAG: ferrous iron transport protein B [Clostridia bacterium]|nr:ferrous iron transport protein B [Clostridia bacterium]
MGLTVQSTGTSTAETDVIIQKKHSSDCILALAGNPNVGKSTVFNALTGLRQHTGNWPGKTVTNARGTFSYHNKDYILVDLPGTYSLVSHSREEEVARDFLYSRVPDGVLVVCDATCMERNLNLVLQILEITSKVVVCINLMDEARKKKIHINLDALSQQLGVPVVGISAKTEEGFPELLSKMEAVCQQTDATPRIIPYPEPLETAILELEMELCVHSVETPRFFAMKLLTEDVENLKSLPVFQKLLETPKIHTAQTEIKQKYLNGEPLLSDVVTEAVVKQGEELYQKNVTLNNKNYWQKDRKLDRILTNRFTGIPVMLLLLAGIFWLTITGANYPSELLSSGFRYLEELLVSLSVRIGLPQWLYEMLFCGVFRVVGWITSVMLPPMAIFFPLFTLLEDLGYLPRIAFNLDHIFQKCNACGKQALTMCMGFGCNAAGVVGARIIDSKRERLIAILTNSLVPCNGRFPLLIALITMFFTAMSPASAYLGTLYLLLVVILGILMTFLVSFLLSKTLLKGQPSSFTLELPPYRKPRIGKILIRSLLDRTLFVLGRALMIAAPAGLLIWLCANVTVGNATVLSHLCNLFDAVGKGLGMDGVILIGFLLGLPANEIVLPIIMMAYLATGSLSEAQNLTNVKTLLIQNGWTHVTALCTAVFCLFHWPCSTTLMTIKKETGSFRWTALAAIIPTLIGCILCFIIAAIFT